VAKRNKPRRANRPNPGQPRPAEVAPAPVPAAKVAPAAKVVPAAPAAGFWAGFELPWAKLVVFRFVFFALLAVDAFLQLPHAPRYGAGGFNVQHLPGAPLPDPGRPGMTFVFAALSVVFALIAQGTAVRVLLPVATALYGYGYFVSQLDSYQHHYLVFLLLVLLCFVPRRPDPAPPGASADATRFVRSWALRLILVQLAIVYLYAAISKMSLPWVDGTTLSTQVRPGAVRDLVAGIGWSKVAVLIVATELALAATLWWKQAWPAALVLGVGLHVGIELVDLEIGLFSYLMFALYLLIVPDRAYVPLARAGRAFAARLRRVPWPVKLALATMVTSVALGPMLVMPVAAHVLAPLLGVALVLAVAVPLVRGDRPAVARHMAAVALAGLVPVATNALTDVSEDYYRYWAGASRRLGNDADARRAYEGLLLVDPSSEYAHYYLGELELKAGRADAAIAHFKAAQRSRPDRPRSFEGEARARRLLGEIPAERPPAAPTSSDPDVDR